MKRLGIPVILFFFAACKSTQVADLDLSVLDKYWKLVELENKPVQTIAREPHIILRSQENRIAGNGGCNSFFGNYQLADGYRVIFSAIGSTKMACRNMQEESTFFQALTAKRSYARSGNELSFRDSLGIIIARFAFVEGKN